MISTETEKQTTTKQIIINENPDSLEVGSPSKGGAIKVYGNYQDKDTFKAKIDNALELRSYTNSKIQ